VRSPDDLGYLLTREILLNTCRSARCAITEQAVLRRLNTLEYLGKWGLGVQSLKLCLTRLGYYHAEPTNEYTEDVVPALTAFQTDHMMRHIDGYFGDLTYREMVSALLERGLATMPRRDSGTGSQGQP
jgi:hypothetical protein